MKKNLLKLLILLALFFSQKLQAQSVGDYKSVASGEWSALSTWQTYNGAAWVNAVKVPSNLSGAITVKAGDSVAVNGATPTDTTFADQLTVEKGAILYINTNHFFLMDGTGTDLTVKGKVNISSNGVLERDPVTQSSTVDYQGDTLVQNGGFSPITTFDGANAQTVVGFGYFGIVALNNTKGLLIVNNPSFRQINFTVGKIHVTGVLVVDIYSSFSGQSQTSFIDGPIGCIVAAGNNTFQLPVGLGGSYLPATLHVKIDTSSKSEYGIVFSIKDSAAPSFNLPASLNKVSAVRYYTISNAGNAKIDSCWVQLSYDSTDGVSDPANLRIAEGDTAAGKHNWVNLGGVGSATKNGTITTKVNFTTQGAFALANATGGSNILPVHFITLTATVHKQSVALGWKTASEVNTSYFNVERLSAAGNWVTVGYVNANKSSAANNYTFTDATVQSNSNYIYRVKEVDKDGSAYFSTEALARIQGGSGTMNVSILYPNPTKDVLNYYVDAATDNAITVVVTGLNGKVFAVQHSVANQSLQVQLKSLSNGTYFLTFTNETTREKIVKKVVKI